MGKIEGFCLESLKFNFKLLIMNWDTLSKKKAELENARPLPPLLVRNLEEWFRIELTYTSNAIEGNTLTRSETALVVEKGLTVGGKSLKEHLEATNHAHALDWVQQQTTRPVTGISERDVLSIHDTILKGIDDAHAGYYRSVPVRIAGSRVILPNARKVPELMEALIQWLHKPANVHPIEHAAEAHYRLVTIHPFIDGNGRTARLLMNMMMLIYGYPPVIIRKRDRLTYINALEKAQLGGSKEDYLKLIHKSAERSLDIFLNAAQDKPQKEAEESIPHKLLKIGELAKMSGESVTTLRYWSQQGLIDVEALTESGYKLYAPQMEKRIQQIKALKEQRYTLEEIKDSFEKD